MGTGGSQTLQQKRLKFQQMFNRNFELVSQPNDEMFGPIAIYRNKNTDLLQVVLKTISYTNAEQMKKVVGALRERVVSPIPNLISLYHLEEVTITNAFCGSGVVLRIYFQYLERSLKEEMRKRRKHKNYFFSQEQIWKIAISLINALKHLHQLKQFHGQIRVENVLIDGDYHMKLVEKTLLNSMNWQVQLTPDCPTLSKGEGILFSPCILKCLCNKKTQLVSYDPFKGDIWAVGMILLECSSTRQAKDFYDYQKFSVKMKEIQMTIYELRKRYSWELINLIEKMLEEDDEERPSAQQIYQKIRKIPNETIRQLNMTMNESFMNESIRSYM